jgi:hypothetical protein
MLYLKKLKHDLNMMLVVTAKTLHTYAFTKQSLDDKYEK